VHDTFYGIILGQSSTPIRCIDLEVSCGTGENKRREMLTFEVTIFDIRYNCILRRPFLLKFMAVIHTAYATIKMSGSKGITILKSDQCAALACENAALTHAGRFGETEAQQLVVKVAIAHGGSTLLRTGVSKPPAAGTHRPPAEKKNTFVGATSNQPSADQAGDDKKKGDADNKYNTVQRGIDIVGVLPRAPGSSRYLFIRVDTFTKWMEVVPAINITQDAAVKFL
jgi:hypothetical protein